MTDHNDDLVVNKIKTPDGTILYSRSVHDYKTYLDKNGSTYMVDGGISYLRRNLNREPYEELSLYVEDPISTIRESYEWGTFGKDPDYKEYTWVKLKNLSNNHIEAILDTQRHLPTRIYNLFKRELDFRLEEGYYVDEVDDYGEV